MAVVALMVGAAHAEQPSTYDLLLAQHTGNLYAVEIKLDNDPQRDPGDYPHEGIGPFVRTGSDADIHRPLPADPPPDDGRKSFAETDDCKVFVTVARVHYDDSVPNPDDPDRADGKEEGNLIDGNFVEGAKTLNPATREECWLEGAARWTHPVAPISMLVPYFLKITFVDNNTDPVVRDWTNFERSCTVMTDTNSDGVPDTVAIPPTDCFYSLRNQSTPSHGAPAPAPWLLIIAGAVLLHRRARPRSSRP